MPPQQTNPYPSYVSQTGRPAGGGRQKLVFAAVFGIAVLVMVLIISLLAGKSKIIVDVTSDRSGEITYRFVSQANPNDVTEIKDTAKHIELSLGSGSYELTVKQEELNHFSIINTEDDAAISVAPQAERGRRYVGNLPKECMHLLNNRLVSYACSGTLADFQTHVPATAKAPTYNIPNPAGTEDVVEGLIKTKEGSLLLIHEAAEAGHEEFEQGSGFNSPHVAFILKDGLTSNFENRTPLTDLAEINRYNIQPYRDGFIAYDTVFTKAFYYPSIKSKAESLNLDRPEEAELIPYALTASGQSFAIAYADEGGKDPGSASVVTVSDGKQSKKYDFDKTFGIIRLCGDKKLCGLHENTLYVYDISGNEAVSLYTVSNAQRIDSYDGSLVVVRPNDIISFNTDNRIGSIQYSYGEYSDCGLQSMGDSYLVCIEATSGAEAVLYIEQQQASDDIDKKVAKLLEVSEISTVSAYGTFITITPNAGRVEYRKATDDFGYDPEKVRKANEAIRQKLEEVGIDHKKYQITNTLD